jgi:hypothetical protein
VLVNTHATFRWRHGLFAAFDYDQLKSFNADVYITLMDNAESVHQRADSLQPVALLEAQLLGPAHHGLTVGEVVFNMDVWKGLSVQHQEMIKSAANEAFLIWWAKWQKQNAEALARLLKNTRRRNLIVVSFQQAAVDRFHELVVKPRGHQREPVVEAVASTGVGVFDTLKAVAKQVLTELRKS